MKTTTYTVSQKDENNIAVNYAESLSKMVRAFDKNPERYGKKTSIELRPNWVKLATEHAIFQQLVLDGLASIEKIADADTTFADTAGDCFNPDICDMPADELKRQERNARARFNRLGCFGFSLQVKGLDTESIWGFVGDDFYGSGYDSDFYYSAIADLETIEPAYIARLKQVCRVLEL